MQEIDKIKDSFKEEPLTPEFMQEIARREIERERILNKNAREQFKHLLVIRFDHNIKSIINYLESHGLSRLDDIKEDQLPELIKELNREVFSQ